MNFRTLGVTFLACLFCGAGVAWAQAYPSKPVRVIVPFPPGGANDIVARIVFQKVSEQMGQNFIIDNRAGAGGTIGTAMLAQSKPDGYTLMVQTVASHVSNAHLYKNLPYDALADFTPITPLALQACVLTVHPSMPTRTVKEFLALAKQRPKEIIFAHAGYGSFFHLNTVMLESMTGIQITQVPFKGGGPAVVGLISGETQAITAGIGDVLQHVKAKRARALGVTTLERSPLMPDVPPIADTVPGYESTTWISLFAPARMPKALSDQLHGAVGKAMREPEVASRLVALTYDAVHKPGEELNQRLLADYARIGELFRKFGVTIN